MNVIARIKNASFYPLAYSIVASQSVIARAKAFGKKPVIHFQKTYAGEKILLIALYEKGRLRPDILNLLDTAKSAGLYVVAVNTLEVLQPESIKDRIDCYIERPNFGRDFGSYQTGFLHLFKQGWEMQCPRLLMVNDSLFYSKQNLAIFLDQMTNTDIEVLGATENHDFEYHLGAFCISFNTHILKHKAFKKYWFNYKNSDVRPHVIQHGEIAFSRTLKRCITSSEQIKAIFDISWMAERLQTDATILKNVFYLNRDSDIFPWRKPSIHELVDKFESKFKLGYKKDSYFIKNNRRDESFIIVTMIDYISALQQQNMINDEEAVLRLIIDELKSLVINCFSSGSQIHNFGLLLHYYGLPIIKADALYRGVFAASDVEKIVKSLHADEIAHFRRIMYGRPYGGDHFFGWKKSAFYRSLI